MARLSSVDATARNLMAIYGNSALADYVWLVSYNGWKVLYDARTDTYNFVHKDLIGTATLPEALATQKAWLALNDSEIRGS